MTALDVASGVGSGVASRRLAHSISPAQQCCERAQGQRHPVGAASPARLSRQVSRTAAIPQFNKGESGES